MYDINNEIAHMISIAQIHKDAIRLQESLDDFIMNFGDDGRLQEEYETVKNLRLLFYRIILDQAEVAVRDIEIDFQGERDKDVYPRLT